MLSARVASGAGEFRRAGSNALADRSPGRLPTPSSWFLDARPRPSGSGPACVVHWGATLTLRSSLASAPGLALAACRQAVCAVTSGPNEALEPTTGLTAIRKPCLHGRWRLNLGVSPLHAAHNIPISHCFVHRGRNRRLCCRDFISGPHPIGSVNGDRGTGGFCANDARRRMRCGWSRCAHGTYRCGSWFVDFQALGESSRSCYDSGFGGFLATSRHNSPVWLEQRTSTGLCRRLGCSVGKCVLVTHCPALS